MASLIIMMMIPLYAGILYAFCVNLFSPFFNRLYILLEKKADSLNLSDLPKVMQVAKQQNKT